MAGLTGGPALAPGANVGKNMATFEQGTRHVGLDIAGKDIANPTGIILASAIMLVSMRVGARVQRRLRPPCLHLR